MRRTSGPLAIGIVLTLLGFLVVAQLRSQALDQGLAALSVQELTELVANVTTRNNQLRDGDPDARAPARVGRRGRRARRHLRVGRSAAT